MRLLKILLLALLCLAVSLGPRPPAVDAAGEAAHTALQNGIALVRARHHNPTFADWEACAASLTFLLQQGDPDAREFGLRVLPRLAEVDLVLDREIMNLAYDSYTDWQSLQAVLRTLPLKDQLYLVLVLDDLDPVDWLPDQGDQKLLLDANPELKYAYRAKKANGGAVCLAPRNGQ